MSLFMSSNFNGTAVEIYETSGLTSFSEIFVITAALIAIALNSCYRFPFNICIVFFTVFLFEIFTI